MLGLHCSVWASHCGGFCCCGAQAPDAQAQQLWLTGLVAPRHVGSSRTRARTRVPCIGRWILNHCATREVPISLLYSPTCSGQKPWGVILDSFLSYSTWNLLANPELHLENTLRSKPYSACSLSLETYGLFSTKQSEASFLFKLLFFWATLLGMWDLSSPTRDQTRSPCSGSPES